MASKASVGPVTCFALSALVVTIAAASGQGPSATSRVALLTQSDVGSRLRMFGKPGDYLLRGDKARAVVRRKDGWLVDFHPTATKLPTAAQLGTLCDIDALWQVYPVVWHGGNYHALYASAVVQRGDRVEAQFELELASARIRVLTSYELTPSAAQLTLHSQVSVDGTLSGPVGFGDAVRWGNVRYVIEGVAQAPPKFVGDTRYIGRRGAGGDLKLRRRDGAPMRVEFKESEPGFAGIVHALYGIGRDALPLTVSRELVFEALPRPARTPVAELGTAALTIRDERGLPLPAKVQVRDAAGKPFEFDHDGHLDGAGSFMWTGNGDLERELPAGKYELTFSAGIERALVRRTLTVHKRQTSKLAVTLARVIDSPGYLAADLHLHQAASVDADIDNEARLVSIAAEGVEFAVATDHYVVTDYAPTLRSLVDSGLLVRPPQVMSGSEVSTLGNRFGHFNVFPLAANSRVLYEDTTPAELFRSARQASPSGVLQVNHPRWEAKTGYFTRFDLDPNSGAPRAPGYSPDFDTVEVYNGVDAHDLPSVEGVLKDWLHLLSAGHRYAATGSSDSHKLAFLDPGVPRTMVRHGEPKSDDDDARASAESILRAIKRGHSFVTSGPYLEASVDGRGPGETVPVTGRTVRVQLRVRAAPWIDVTEIEVYSAGSDAPRVRRKLARSISAERFVGEIPVALEAPSYIVVVARGERLLPTAAQPIKPFAFTNPIWLVQPR